MDGVTGRAVGFILTVHNFRDRTAATLDSLRRATTYPYKVVVVDNASTDGTSDYFRARGEEVITVPEHCLTHAVNLGIERFLADPEIGYMSHIHNDMLFYSSWLERLVSVMKRDSRIGRLSPYNFYPGPPERYPEEYAQAFMAEHADDPLVPGNTCPWLIRKGTIKEVGLFDEGYLGAGGYDDWDYNNRLLERGYTVMITLASACWHEIAGIRRHTDDRRATEHNARYYFEKWGQTTPRV